MIWSLSMEVPVWRPIRPGTVISLEAWLTLQRAEKARGPGVDVVARNRLEDRLVPLAPFVQRHGKRLSDRRSDAVGIVRVDQQRFLAFVCGAGEARKNEDAGILWILRGDIFLGDEVHAVAQRRHQPDACAAIEAGERRTAVGAVDIADRRPVRLAVGAVDAA